MIGGVLVGALLNVGICFAGLQIGFGIVGSAVAAVLGFGLLRGVLRRGEILEVNIFQTIASGVNIVNSGVIFTLPVLFLMGLEEQIDYSSVILAAIAGSLLGVMLIIPLRKQVIDFERLRFPEGTAVATILKSPGAGIEKARLLLIGVFFGAGLTFVTTMGWCPGIVNLGEFLGIPSGLRVVFAVHALSLGAGYLAGRPGLAILYGSALNFWFLIPLCLVLGWLPDVLSSEFADYAPFTGKDADNYELSGSFAGKFRKGVANRVGIGMILGGAIAGIAIALPALKAALGSLKRSGSGEGPRDELSLRFLSIGTIVGLVLLFVATLLSGGEYVSVGQAVIVTLVAGVWLWLAGLVVAQTTGRTDWSPLSGLSLIAVTLLIGILGTSMDVLPTVITVGAATCVATAMCADMMADLKTGYLIGGRPRLQQLAQISICWIGPAIAIGTVALLWNVYAFGDEQAEILYERDRQVAVEAGPAALAEFDASGRSKDELPEGVPTLGAPQAAALKSVIETFQKDLSDIPLGRYAAGAAIGLVASLLFGPSVGVMVGLSLYLPFFYTIVFGMGGITNMIVQRWKGHRFAEDKGVPIAAGLIVGTALVEVVFALKEVIKSSFGDE
jgi:putative OPT family oligopeptide transporter